MPFALHGQSGIPVEVPAEENKVEYSAVLSWESKYVSEGRDNLDDGGIASVEGVVGYEGFSAGIWYGLADAVSYDELDLFVEYALELGAFEFYGGYARLEFLKDNAFDNEFSAGVALDYFSWLIPAIDYVYATEGWVGDGGSFINASLASPIELLDGSLVLEPYVLEGFDLGYASDNYNGFNNFQFGVVAEYKLSEMFVLVGSVNHSMANQDVRKDGYDDETWFSVGLGAAF